MNLSKFVAIPCNLFKAREKLRVQVAIGFPSYWLINRGVIFKTTTKHSKCNRVITFDSHLKTALKGRIMYFVLFYSLLTVITPIFRRKRESLDLPKG